MTDQPGPEPEPVLRAVDLVAPVFAASRLDELEVEVGGLLVRLVRPRPEPPAAPVGSVSPAPSSAAGAPAALPSPFGAPAPGMRFVTAPLTGVWYGAPSPGARPYLKLGDEIAVGQVVGLIEAMKLFNEIKSDAAGRVTRLMIDSGTLVKRQQPLIEVDPRQ
jgi:acetyl-CoA carboxylase biotin carboxyl carrier protein